MEGSESGEHVRRLNYGGSQRRNGSLGRRELNRTGLQGLLSGSDRLIARFQSKLFGGVIRTGSQTFLCFLQQTRGRCKTVWGTLGRTRRLGRADGLTGVAHLLYWGDRTGRQP